MLQRALVSCLLLGAGLAIACSGDDALDRKGGPLPDSSDGGSKGIAGDASGGEPALALPSCVLQVVHDKCQRCHGNPLQHGAPVAFFTVNDFQARYFDSDFEWWEIAADRVEADSMPFVSLNNAPKPPMPPVEPLTPTEKTTLLDWLKAGALPDDGTACP